MEYINLKNISKTYGKNDARVQALKDISLTVNSGEMLCIMGASGSGKSTLLNIIGCLDKPSSGEYILKQENINEYKAKGLAKIRNKTFGFVVQYFGLLDDYTVYENIQIPLEYSKTPRNKRKILIENMLDKLKIKEKSGKTPTELSGGQNQRVAIARALVNNPDIILADEPTGALDRRTSGEVMDIFKKLNDEGKTIIIVTHDEKVASKCKRIVTLDDGKIISDRKE